MEDDVNFAFKLLHQNSHSQSHTYRKQKQRQKLSTLQRRKSGYIKSTKTHKHILLAPRSHSTLRNEREAWRNEENYIFAETCTSVHFAQTPWLARIWNNLLNNIKTIENFVNKSQKNNIMHKKNFFRANLLMIDVPICKYFTLLS